MASRSGRRGGCMFGSSQPVSAGSRGGGRGRGVAQQQQQLRPLLLSGAGSTRGFDYSMPRGRYARWGSMNSSNISQYGSNTSFGLSGAPTMTSTTTNDVMNNLSAIDSLPKAEMELPPPPPSTAMPRPSLSSSSSTQCCPTCKRSTSIAGIGTTTEHEHQQQHGFDIVTFLRDMSRTFAVLADHVDTNQTTTK